MLTHETALELFCYDPQTGVVTNKVTRNSRSVAGAVSGTLNANGYRQIIVDRERYYTHRLVWLYMYGVWPEDQIDHVNGDRDDNRIVNLRAATKKQNMENVPLRVDNKSGARGVHYCKSKRRWIAQVGSHGVHYHLGRYRTREEAVTAAKHARDILFSHNKTEYSA